MIDNSRFLGVVTSKLPDGVLSQLFSPFVNKLPNYLNAAENKFDSGNLYTNGENYRGKTPSGDFEVTTPKNPLLSIISNYKYKEFYQTL